MTAKNILFIIPVVFAFYPELVLIPASKLDPMGDGNDLSAFKKTQTLTSAVPIMQSRVTKAASSASFIASVPAGRSGSTI